MTVIVSIKINDGIVMASDSASTFGTGQNYLNADKIVNLVKGLPIGAMVTGNGGIGSESIATLLKDFRRRLDGSIGHEWALIPEKYTIKDVAERLREFLFEEKTLAADLETWMRIRVCGYSAGRPLPEIWDLFIAGRACEAPTLIRGEDAVGPNWDGEYEALDRLNFGLGSTAEQELLKEGLLEADVGKVCTIVSRSQNPLFVLAAMPIQDAIDLARFFVETTVNYVRFSAIKHPKSVGGPVEIAAITKHEGFRWIQRRHFFSNATNPL